VNCDHAEHDLVLTPELIHHGKYVCRQCRKFIGWAKNPQTLERDKRNQETIARLKSTSLTEWEQGFVLSLEKQGNHFSPKQQAMLDKLAAAYA
jgi:hypothetical protein